MYDALGKAKAFDAPKVLTTTEKCFQVLVTEENLLFYNFLHLLDSHLKPNKSAKANKIFFKPPLIRLFLTADVNRMQSTSGSDTPTRTFHFSPFLLVSFS